jgi:hypothetical protein
MQGTKVKLKPRDERLMLELCCMLHVGRLFRHDNGLALSCFGFYSLLLAGPHVDGHPSDMSQLRILIGLPVNLIFKVRVGHQSKGKGKP